MSQKRQQDGDLRVRRTRAMLVQALIDLTTEKGFAALTVQEIAERAMVNRATFYRHYLDKHDLLEAYVREVYELSADQERLSKAGAAGPPVGLVRLLEHVQQHTGFYRVMLGAQGDPTFVAWMRQFIEQRLRSLLPSDAMPRRPDSPPHELCLSYLAHASIGVLHWWLQEEQPRSPTQIASWLADLSTATIAQLLGRPGPAEQPLGPSPYTPGNRHRG